MVYRVTLTGGEEVGLTSALLSNGLFLQVLHDVAMFPLEWLSLRGPLGLDLPDGLGTGSFGFLDDTASGCLGFLDCTVEQAVLASRITREQLVLPSKVNWEQVVWASRVAWEQTALASLIDSAAWDSFQWSTMPSSQMALCLQASMDALVVSRSSRDLLAFAHGNPVASTRGVMLLVLEMAAIAEMLAGMSTREASTTSALA